MQTTAEPVTALVPITIYILFFGGMISSIVPGLNGQEEYVKAIPFNFFCIICLVVGLLTALEVIPDFGYMKKREKAAREILIFVIGHAINIFMNVLGAMVHPMRLTFVEFFKNSGYEGGGKEYKPFRN